MCSGLICGVITIAVGVVLAIGSSIVGFVVIPDIVENTIINEVVLLNETVQMERFIEVPFPLNFTIRVFNISNAEQVLEGAIPVMTEVGPYVYKLYQTRQVEDLQEDRLTYRRLDHFEFDPEASFPRTEDDLVNIANVAYHGVLHVAERQFPGLLPVLSLALSGVFGPNLGPVLETRVRDLLFDGITLCANPGLVGAIACNLIREMSENIQNMEAMEDGSIRFSVLGYRNGKPGQLHEAYRGLEKHADLGRIIAYNERSYLTYWPRSDQESQSVCNMINGTDSGIFNPFIDRNTYLYALNTDICRSVELRYQSDVEYSGIPAVRFSANEWFLDNEDGCFCLNVTTGVNAADGCLLRGAQELFSCVGAYMVLTYPHFLYADMRYRNGVLGMNPIEDNHRIFLDLEPNTGTVVRGFKRAQFNVFMRPVAGIAATSSLRTTLTPLLWLEEGLLLPDEYSEELKSRLLSTLNLLDVLIPVVVTLSFAVLMLGVVVVAWMRFKKKPSNI